MRIRNTGIWIVRSASLLILSVISVADLDPHPSDPYVIGRLGLLDPDPLVRGMDPDPDPSIIKQKQ
jgi:hypothetical protein